MMQPTFPAIENLVRDLPDPDGARRFFLQFNEKNRSAAGKLLKNESLLSDLLTLAAFSPLLATTLVQNPEYVVWLARQKQNVNVCSKEELLESLARFSLTNSQHEAPARLARFRRRELLRIYLRDVRRLKTIAEITEELSNLADSILEYALRLARQELDNRFGTPLETDRKGRSRIANFSVFALGKLGSRELNYSSDIDLLFVYSADGATSGSGAKGAVTNREYFIKLAELVSKIVGGQNFESAYRVDLRLRPRGRIGALAVSLGEAVEYYRTEARAWERQVLIRARSAAGDSEVFKDFFSAIESSVFSEDATVAEALESVRLSKEKINFENHAGREFNVKLGRGGIREIEFIAQALQLAHGGRDAWLRAPHTLVSLSRLADRRLLSEIELTELFEAYNFLRRLEHRLQMEHGLQTHLVPFETEKRRLVARRMNFPGVEDFDRALNSRTQNVSRVFARVFGETAEKNIFAESKNASPLVAQENLKDANVWLTGKSLDSADAVSASASSLGETAFRAVLQSLEKSEAGKSLSAAKLNAVRDFARVSPHFAAMLAANPSLVQNFPTPEDRFAPPDYRALFRAEIKSRTDFAGDLAALRRVWSSSILEIASADAFGKIDSRRAKALQTQLAEASVSTALSLTAREIKRRGCANYELRMDVLGLGKLGGRGMDYGSDLDLVLICDDEQRPPENETPAEFYSRAAEIFVAALSSFTRDGNLYRVDLRLRPDGKNGANVIGKTAFLAYLRNRSAIWEWLAYVKLRDVSGDDRFGRATEEAARQAIHERARGANVADLRAETRRVRSLLEKKKPRHPRDVDIKYGEGGMLDVYFATRFLQLRDNVPDEAENRSTFFTLEKLRACGSLGEENFTAFSDGYGFLSELDHNIRLVVGRSTLLPRADPRAFGTIARRMNFASIDELLEKLAFHRMLIRAAFENVLG